jgi:Secretion system C-terminal sorting domain
VLVNYLNMGGRPTVGLIEPIPSVLYGAGDNKIFKYNFNTNIYTVLSGVQNNIRYSGDLVKASDGNLYLPVNPVSNCNTQIALPFKKGGIIKVNTITDVVSTAQELTCLGDLGSNPIGKLIEAVPGKLYGILQTGEGYDLPNDPNAYYRRGALFEFNILNGSFTKKMDFVNTIHGDMPSEMLVVGDGYLYGVCQESTKEVLCTTPPIHNAIMEGTIWKYNPITNDLNIIKEIGDCNDVSNTRVPTSIMKTSSGHFMCTFITPQFPGLFKYDPITNIITMPPFVFPLQEVIEPANLIEICRKPSYQEFIVNTFTPTVGTAFTYDVVNTNATNYVWKKGTILLPAQTTGVLNLPNITTNDTGVYTCTMTNECGTTITANLNINVVNLAVETVDDYKTLISLYPNPTKGLLNLKFPENRGLKGIKYKITNLLGQVIIENDISTSNKNELAINTSSFANGVYQLTLVTDKGNWNGKFLKE